MSTTDPLRDALERIVSAGTKPIDSTLSKSLQFKARGQAMLDIAAATLAAVPAEPNTTCVQGDDAKSAAEKLAVPAEPEAWEWRALNELGARIAKARAKRASLGLPTCADDLPSLRKLTALMEEVGEVAEAIQAEEGHERLRDELFDVAVCSILWAATVRDDEAGPWERVDPEPPGASAQARQQDIADKRRRAQPDGRRIG